MFLEDFEKLTRSEKALFSEAVNDLLYQCFIVRRIYDRKMKMFKTNPDYLYIDRHFELIEDYLSYINISLSKSDEDGIIFISSGIEKNHLRLDVVTTLIVYALRSYYEDQISRFPEEITPRMTYGILNTFLQETGLSNLTKRLSSSTIASSLRVLDSYNIITKIEGSYGDPAYSFCILPTIRYIISSEKMNTLYNFLTKKDDNFILDSFERSEE